MIDGDSPEEAADERLRTTRTIRALLRQVEALDEAGTAGAPAVTRVVVSSRLPQRPHSPAAHTATAPATARTEEAHTDGVADARPTEPPAPAEPPTAAEPPPSSTAAAIMAEAGAAMTSRDESYFVIPPLPPDIEVVHPVFPRPAPAPAPAPPAVRVREAPAAKEDIDSSETKERPESSRRRARSPPPTPTPPAPLPPPVASVTAAPPAAATAAASSARPTPPPLVLGEFTADDILLWLQTSAFKKRSGAAARKPMDSAMPLGGKENVRRTRILDEVRKLQRSTRAGM